MLNSGTHRANYAIYNVSLHEVLAYIVVFLQYVQNVVNFLRLIGYWLVTTCSFKYFNS
jgi:purine-cytosine permease-like protein